MSNIFRFPERRRPGQQLVDLLRSEIDAKSDAIKRPVLGKILVTWLIVATIGTMVTTSSANVFFSITAVLTLFIMLACRKRTTWTLKQGAVAVVLLTSSMITGCSGAWVADINQKIVGICESESAKPCLIGQSVGWAVLGITVSEASIDQAMSSVGITHAIYRETVKTVGLISVTRTTVYGS